jgi:hypothetical protein
MSRQWDDFVAGAAACWLDLQTGSARELCAGGSSSWLRGYRTLLDRPPAERGAFLVALAGGFGPGASRRG